MSEINKCESPIEKQFFCSWKNLVTTKPCSHWAIFSEIGPDNFEQSPEVTTYNYFLHHSGADYLFVQPRIGRFRVDFAVCRLAIDMGESIEDPARLIRLPVVIDFHERTKEQAQKDKSRDRDLQVKGYRVMRFTGSELHKDAAGCVQLVCDLFDQMQRDIVKRTVKKEQRRAKRKLTHA